MNERKTGEEAAVERFEATQWERTWCSVQDSFEAFSLAVRNDLKAELGSVMPELGKLTFNDVNTIQLIVGFGALREGARAYLSLLQEPSAPVQRQIEYERLWRAVSSTNDPKSGIHKALRRRLEALPHMDAVLTFAGNSLHSNLIRKLSFLKEHEERLRQMVFVNLLYGVKMEYLFPLLAGEVEDEARVLQRLLDTSSSINGETEAIKRLKKQYGIRDESQPWPRDLRCICGEGLERQLTCCDPDAPIDISAVAKDITPEYLFKTDCCGASYTGVRCRKCARFYSWSNGIVETVGD